MNIEYTRNDSNLGETYTIEEASIQGSTSNSLMKSGAKALDVVINKNKNGQWELQKWIAQGQLMVPITGIELTSDVQVAYTKSDLKIQANSQSTSNNQASELLKRTQ